ncbi:MAG: hypothetical protein AAF399_26600, partial [Bacteroidota bacterium]
MQKIAIFSVVLFLTSLFTLQAQNYKPNLSLQIGTEARLFSPSSLNFVVDSIYNATYRGVNPDMDAFRWT